MNKRHNSENRGIAAQLAVKESQAPVVWLLIAVIFLTLNLGAIMLNVAGPGFLGSPAFLAGLALGGGITIVFGIRSATIAGGTSRLGSVVSLGLTAVIGGVAMGSLASITDFFMGFARAKWIGWPTVLAAGISVCCIPLLLRMVRRSESGCD